MKNSTLVDQLRRLPPDAEVQVVIKVDRPADAEGPVDLEDIDGTVADAHTPVLFQGQVAIPASIRGGDFA